MHTFNQLVTNHSTDPNQAEWDGQRFEVTKEVEHKSCLQCSKSYVDKLEIRNGYCSRLCETNAEFSEKSRGMTTDDPRNLHYTSKDQDGNTVTLKDYIKQYPSVDEFKGNRGKKLPTFEQLKY